MHNKGSGQFLSGKHVHVPLEPHFYKEEMS